MKEIHCDFVYYINKQKKYKTNTKCKIYHSVRYITYINDIKRNKYLNSKQKHFFTSLIVILFFF